MNAIRSGVSADFDLHEGTLKDLRPGELVADVSSAELPAIADRAARHAGGRLATLFATDEREQNGRFAVHHVWFLPSRKTFLRVRAEIDATAAVFPSISGRHPSANWFEREVQDFFGLTPAGHPNPYPVAVHDDWPDGQWALRKDFPGGRTVPRDRADRHPFRPVTGEGVFRVPVGPVHAGIIEPGHFRFGVAGEPVLYLQLRLFYVHKGIEKRFEHLPWRHGLYLAESISGDTAVGHSLAYAHAIERLLAMTVPRRAAVLRAVLLELERIDNHLADIGAIATDVAFVVPASRAQTMRERLLRVQERWLGTRLLRGSIALGGVRIDLSPVAARALRDHVRAIEKEFDDLIGLLIDSGTFTDRVDGTGTLSRQAALDLGIVGVAARASGIDVDLRRDHPTDAYPDLRFEVPVEEGGDVRARLMVRAREVEQSLKIIDRALEELPAGPLQVTLPESLPPRASALGWAEAWRGPCLHWIATDDRSRLTRVKVTDPSFLNWPGLVQAVPGNIIPDFPVINKSFNLSYSGNDR